jgi:hypothetical protein
VRRLALAALLAAAAVPASAGLQADGYLKDLWQYSHGQLDGRPYYLNTTRGRLTLDETAGHFRAHADYDHQVAAGSYFRTLDFKAYGYQPPSPWLTMQSTISTGALNGYGQGVYRGWLGYEGDRLTVRAGRQRIAWGTGKIWNPTDVLNPYQPTAIEPDERRGVDALYARLGVGALGQAELVWAPNDAWLGHDLLARVHDNLDGWDVSALGGKTAGAKDSWMLGGDFAGTVLDGTLHGEWARLDPRARAPYWKADLGWDYDVPDDPSRRWLKNSAFVFEWDYAGNGATDPARYNFAPELAGTEVGVARDYFGTTFSKDLNPLLKLEAAAIVNADDGSTFFSPTLTWSALENLSLSAGLQRFGGERRTEYGREPNQTVLTAQYYF